MNIKELINTFPDYAKDIKLNYSKILNEDILNKKQLYGIILISSLTTQLKSLKDAGCILVLNLLAIRALVFYALSVTTS